MKNAFKKVTAGLLVLAFVFCAVLAKWETTSPFSWISFTANAAENSETFVTTYNGGSGGDTYTGSHFSIAVDEKGDSDGFYLGVSQKAAITSLNDEIITKIELTLGGFNAENAACTKGVRTINGNTITFSDVFSTSAELYGASNFAQISQVKIYYMEGSVSLADNKYKQTADSEGVHYIRYVWVMPKEDVESHKKAVITAEYGEETRSFKTNIYYTGITTNGITYVPASKDSVMIIATITGIPAENEEQLVCELELI